jgi:hypothetical protein
VKTFIHPIEGEEKPERRKHPRLPNQTAVHSLFDGFRNLVANLKEQNPYWGGYAEAMMKEFANVARDAARWNAVVELAGHWQDGSDETVRLIQDDATRSCLIAVGPQLKSRYFGTDRTSFNAAADMLIEHLEKQVAEGS